VADLAALVVVVLAVVDQAEVGRTFKGLMVERLRDTQITNELKNKRRLQS
jgi:hypothetical protein